VAVADLNGDFKPDLVVCNFGSSTVSVLLGNSDGTFQAAFSYSTTAPLALAVADFNGDGIPDLAVTNLSDRSTVSSFLGKGDGTFLTAAGGFVTGIKTGSVAVGDFNGDGIPDLIAASGGSGGHATNSGDGDMAVLLGNGDGTFQVAVHYAAGAGPSSVNVADFNGDGIPDVAIANFHSADISVLLGKGDGTFQAAVSYAIGPYPDDPSSVVLKDFNGDGMLISRWRSRAGCGCSWATATAHSRPRVFRSTPRMPTANLPSPAEAVGDLDSGRNLGNAKAVAIPQSAPLIYWSHHIAAITARIPAAGTERLIAGMASAH
jgi:hypothetical protein